MVARSVWLLAQVVMVGLLIGSTANHLAAGQKTPDKIRLSMATGFVNGVLDFNKAVRQHLKEFSIEAETIPTRGEQMMRPPSRRAGLNLV